MTIKYAVIAAVASALLSGCASTSYTPAFIGPQAECERNGGVWRVALNSCEVFARS